MPEKFGDWLKQNRKSRGWSQRLLASKSGLTDSYISMLETAVRPGISRDAVIKIANALEINPSLALSAAGFLPPSPPAFNEREIRYERTPSFITQPEGHLGDDDPIIEAGARRVAEAAYEAAYEEYKRAMRSARSKNAIGFGKDRYASEADDHS
jgi:transcriptional regulator with XRE-family HTH domain